MSQKSSAALLVVHAPAVRIRKLAHEAQYGLELGILYRAGLCCDPDSAALTRQHNNANVLCMGARILSFEKTVEITDAFLGAEFLGGRHQRRVDMLEN
jgi:hypothetical protein